MSTLPKFHDSFVFAPHKAMHDKIDLRLGWWEIENESFEDWQKFKFFREFMAAPPVNSRELAFKEERLHGTFFLRPQIKGKDKEKMWIRTDRLKHPEEKGRYLNGPLCGGFLQHDYARRNEETPGKVTRHASLTLSLNLLRYMRHQPRRDADIEKASLVAVRLRKRSSNRSSAPDGEWAYDNEDNWIPQSAAWKEFTSRRNRAKHLKNYLEAIRRRVELDGQRAVRVMDGHLGFETAFREIENTFSLSKVETVWEFHSDEPNEEVQRLSHVLPALRKKGATAEVFWWRDERGREGNSLAFKIDLVRNVKLKVYAKTNRRIRFEVVHELTETAAQFAKKAKLAPLTNDYRRRHHGRPMKHLPPMLRAIREDAAKHLNELMIDLRKEGEFTPEPLSALRLLSEIEMSVPQELSEEEKVEMMRTLISLLVHKRGIRDAAHKGRLFEAVKTLRERKPEVIEYDKVRKFDRLTQTYLPAARAFRELAGDMMKAFFGYDRPPLPDKWNEKLGIWVKQR